MRTANHILLLAGSAEARQIAAALVARGQSVTALVSEPPRGDTPMPVPFEMVDFHDCAALSGRMAGFEAVVDASHGFDGLMTRAGFEAATEVGLPFVTLMRDRWSVDEDRAHWTTAPNIRAAMAQIAADARVFSAAGWASLADCAAFPGGRLFLRQTSPHDRRAPYPFVKLVFGDAPFRAASEAALFKELRIDTLLCRNLGGMPSRPKLEAAKVLGLPVILIDPPALPDGVQVLRAVSDVMAWIDAL
jgi:precorrin-6A/cobalt-precorrin-6A reductase